MRHRDNEAVAACVLFRSCVDEHSAEEKVERIGQVEPYEAGLFYRRELPWLAGRPAKRH
jgi:deoxyinosine 3'endonuclease (endonuclease V)